MNLNSYKQKCNGVQSMKPITNHGIELGLLNFYTSICILEDDIQKTPNSLSLIHI